LAVHNFVILDQPTATIMDMMDKGGNRVQYRVHVDKGRNPHGRRNSG